MGMDILINPANGEPYGTDTTPYPVKIMSLVPGTGATALGKAEDAAHNSGDVGVMALAVQKATPADISTDGDYTPLQVSGGKLWAKASIDQTTDGTTNLVRARDSFDVAVSVTRPANVNTYGAGDVVGAAAAALTFASMGPSGGAITITGAEFEIDRLGVISGETSYRLHLYNVTPPSALADEATWNLQADDRASYLGFVDLNTPVDLGSTLYVQSIFVGKDIKLSSANLFAYLVTAGGYIAESATVHKITLHATAR